MKKKTSLLLTQVDNISSLFYVSKILTCFKCNYAPRLFLPKVEEALDEFFKQVEILQINELFEF